jgi:Alginate export
MRLLGILTAMLCLPSIAAARQTPAADVTEPAWAISGEVRIQYERFANEEWGAAPEDGNGYVLQRIMLGARRRINPRLMAFLEVKSGIEVGRAGGPRLPDEDRLDLHQAYADVSIGRSMLRVGRQELQFGSSRLVSTRDLNVPQSFDAVRWTSKITAWRLDLFGAAPARTRPGVLDDAVDDNRALWGAYGVHSGSPSRGIDVYYFGYRNARARFDDAAGDERRHSVGTRVWGRYQAIEYNTELIGQWGNIGGDRIRAWTVASQTSYRFPSLTGGQFVLRADVTSGDPRRGDGSVGTFSPLFPRGDYFGLIASAGPLNHIDVYPRVEWRLLRRGLVSAGWLTFWRTQRNDGIYTFSGRLLRSGLSTSARLVGRSPSLTVQWDHNRQLSFVGHVSAFTAGPFIRETTGDHPTMFVRLCATYRLSN